MPATKQLFIVLLKSSIDIIESSASTEYKDILVWVVTSHFIATSCNVTFFWKKWKRGWKIPSQHIFQYVMQTIFFQYRLNLQTRCILGGMRKKNWSPKCIYGEIYLHVQVYATLESIFLFKCLIHIHCIYKKCRHHKVCMYYMAEHSQLRPTLYCKSGIVLQSLSWVLTHFLST